MTGILTTGDIDRLVDLLEDVDCQVPKGSLVDVVIDYSMGDLRYEVLVKNYECSPGRSTRILSTLNQATGGSVPITENDERR